MGLRQPRSQALSPQLPLVVRSVTLGHTQGNLIELCFKVNGLDGAGAIQLFTMSMMTIV